MRSLCTALLLLGLLCSSQAYARKRKVRRVRPAIPAGEQSDAFKLNKSKD